jgi:hypothetical protein
MLRLAWAIFLVAMTLAGAGCATTKDEGVSSIPWNRPQQWEGSGALGGFRPPGSPGY